jgi:hypothetical protein
MNQFTFEGKQKRVLIGMMILGIICLALSFFDNAVPHHSRFWTNYLHNTVFFTGIAFTSMFIMAASITAYAGWFTVFKRIWEAYGQFLIVGLLLMLVIVAGIWGDLHHIYHWADDTAVASDALLQGKASFLNKYWYTFGTIIIVGIWFFFTQRMRSLSLQEDTSGTADFAIHNKIKVYAAIFLPIAAFSSAALIWLWTMSIDPHWYSTMYAWYTTSSWFVSALALTILTIIYLKSKGYLPDVSDEHLHDLGKYMFAFSIFWAYLWFSQYMLIWYANIGEETIYFKLRRDEYPVLFYGNLVMNFYLPFLILMRNDTKRKYGVLTFTSILLLFGHWWDFFCMIKPGVYKEVMHAAGEHVEHVGYVPGFSIPGLIELGVFIGFLGFFMYLAFNQLTKASLKAERDPYYAESVHHHV